MFSFFREKHDEVERNKRPFLDKFYILENISIKDEILNFQYFKLKFDEATFQSSLKSVSHGFQKISTWIRLDVPNFSMVIKSRNNCVSNIYSTTIFAIWTIIFER